MLYKAADSVMISAAKRGCFEAPGIRDTRMIRVTMIMVERVVVPTDNAYVVAATAVPVFSVINTGPMSIIKYVMPIAESPCQYTSNLEYTDQPMEATFKMSGITAILQLRLQMIQQRQT